MNKNLFVATLFVVSLALFGSKSDASLVLVIDDNSTAGYDAVVIDNQPAGSTSSGGNWTSTIADSNMTLGGVVFNGSTNNFDINVSTGVSKPLVTNNQIDLNSIVASYGAGGGEIQMYVLDTDFVSNGLSNFRTQIGGTSSGVVGAISMVSPSNGDEESDFGPVAISPDFDDTPFSWMEDNQVTGLTTFGMAVGVSVRLENPGMSSFDLNFQQVPEPATALIWTTLAGVGLVIRRRR